MACWCPWHCPPFLVSSPSPQAIHPGSLAQLRTLVPLMGVACSQTARALERETDRGPGEEQGSNRVQAIGLLPFPTSPPRGLLSVVGWRQGTLQTSLLGHPLSWGQARDQASVQPKSEPVSAPPAFSHLWQVMPPGHLAGPSPSSASVPGPPPQLLDIAGPADTRKFTPVPSPGQGHTQRGPGGRWGLGISFQQGPAE